MTNLPKLMREHADYMETVTDFVGSPGAIAKALRDGAKEIERQKTLLEEVSTNPEGDYYLGLRCGVEDRDIYDRYDAAEYGWDQAFERVASVVR